MLHEMAGQFRLLPKIAVVAMLALLIAITARGQPTFKDVSDKLGLKLRILPAAWADFDNDGFVDLCVGDELWRNDCAKKFTKIRDDLGTSVMADFDNDGLIDLFAWSVLKLFRNVNGTGTGLVEVSLPQLPASASKGASCGDFDKDGYVDIYLGGYEREDKDKTFVYYDIILINVKGQSFKRRKTSFLHPARGVTACDFDRDADLDIYVSNYRLRPNLLWKNVGSGLFSNVAETYGVDGDYDGSTINSGFNYGFTIGSCWGDLDNDSHIDLFVGNLSHPSPWQDRSMFYRNMGPSNNYHFQDKSATAGLAWRESYASPALGDYDNDGDLDLFLTAVGGEDYPFQHSVLYRNDGNWTFRDVTDCVDLSHAMPHDPLDGYQAAWADFDNDGDLDLVTDGKLFINQGNTNSWLKVHLQGDGKQVNRSAIGAQVRIKLKGEILTRQVEAGTGQGNQNDLTLHFGLGTHNKPVNLEIFWPNGTTQRVKQVRPNQTKPVLFAEIK